MISLQFKKWHGLGNDFILMETTPALLPVEDIRAFARQVCNRNFGIGGDGLVLIFKDDRDLINMRIFNADGSEAEMCGNAIRCVAKYVWQQGIVRDKAFPVQTGAGVMVPEVILDGKEVASVRVDMGEPVLEGDLIPVSGYSGRRVLEEPVNVDGRSWQVTAVSMGNPHCLLFVPSVSEAPVQQLGPRLETHNLFPNKTNVEFIEVKSRDEIKLRVWERGVGETLACGTGTCAAVVGGILTDRLNRKVQVNLAGGQLFVEWRENGRVYLTGSATEVFEGRLSEEFCKHAYCRVTPSKDEK